MDQVFNITSWSPTQRLIFFSSPSLFVQFPTAGSTLLVFCRCFAFLCC